MKKGFTLIELLVVCAIITILAALVLVNYTNSQKKARDNKRKADLQSLYQAAVMYKDADTDSKYPLGNGVVNSTNTILMTNLSPYLNPIPREAKVDKGMPEYYYYTNSSTAYFYSNLEVITDPQAKLCTIDSVSYRYAVPSQTYTLNQTCYTNL